MAAVARAAARDAGVIVVGGRRRGAARVVGRGAGALGARPSRQPMPREVPRVAVVVAAVVVRARRRVDAVAFAAERRGRGRGGAREAAPVRVEVARERQRRGVRERGVARDVDLVLAGRERRETLDERNTTTRVGTAPHR